jgi:hypothetical protein
MRRKVMIPVLLILIVVGLVWLWHEPSIVNAQSASNATNPNCTSSTLSSSNALYPLFACVADLDATGTKEIIVGVQNSTSAAGQPGTYKITIINPNGTVRATITIP